MLKVTLLGTGGTQPLPDRALAAAAVTVGGRSVLLDCGEGTQVGLRRYGVSAYRLSAVLLTHYHGDHILGLPGLLQTLGSLNRTEPLMIYGPKGIEPVAQAVTALAGPQAYPVRWQQKKVLNKNLRNSIRPGGVSGISGTPKSAPGTISDIIC